MKGDSETRRGELSQAQQESVRQTLRTLENFACGANQSTTFSRRAPRIPPSCQRRWYFNAASTRLQLPSAEVIIAVMPDSCVAAAIRTAAVTILHPPSYLVRRVWIATTEPIHPNLSAVIDRLPRVYITHITSPNARTVTDVRQLASHSVTSNVIVFLTPGVLPYPGWLEPLAAEFVEDDLKGRRPTLALPATPPRKRGAPPPTVGHDWALRRLQFARSHMSGFAEEALPAHSPLLPHADFAISTKFWRILGGYDQVGGETELALRAWACGGSVATIPCSRIGRPSGAVSTSLPREERLAVARKWFGPYAMLAALANGYLPNSTLAEELEISHVATRCSNDSSFRAYMGAAFPEMQPSAQIMLGHNPRRGPRAWGRLRLKDGGKCVRLKDYEFIADKCEHASVLMHSRQGYLMAAPRLTATCVTRTDDTAIHSQRCDIFFYNKQRWDIEVTDGGRYIALFARVNGEPRCLTIMPGGRLSVAACNLERSSRQAWVWEFTSHRIAMDVPDDDAAT